MTALRHLAPEILSQSETIPEAYKPAMTFGRELYAYFLAVSSICSLKPSSASSTIEATAFAFSGISKFGHTGAMFGCSDGLFCLIPEVVAVLHDARKWDAARPLITPRRGKFSSTASDATCLSTDASELASEISLLFLSVSMWEPLDSNDSTFQTSGRILRLALTILLTEASYWCRVSEAKLRQTGECVLRASPRQQHTLNLELQTVPLVAEFVTLLKHLPVQSWIVTTMCWPMAVLGSYATCQTHRTAIRLYLVNMEATFGFKNMNRTRLLLEYIWSKISTFEVDRPMDISEAMAEIGGHFLLG